MTGEGGRPTVHATALLLGDAGILIRGPSGAGKSALARELIVGGERDGRFARLVADDRVDLSARDGRLIARPHPAIAGRIEMRGLGIVIVPFEPACVVRLVVDLAEEQPRMPGRGDRDVSILDVALPRIRSRPQDARSLIEWQLSGSRDTILNVE